jgi:hypothetical protein
VAEKNLCNEKVPNLKGAVTCQGRPEYPVCGKKLVGVTGMVDWHQLLKTLECFVRVFGL